MLPLPDWEDRPESFAIDRPDAWPSENRCLKNMTVSMLYFLIVLDILLHNEEYLTSYTHDIPNP